MKINVLLFMLFIFFVLNGMEQDPKGQRTAKEQNIQQSSRREHILELIAFLESLDEEERQTPSGRYTTEPFIDSLRKEAADRLSPAGEK